MISSNRFRLQLSKCVVQETILTRGQQKFLSGERSKGDNFEDLSNIYVALP